MEDVVNTRSKIAHLYRRAGFGARPDELDAAVANGYQETVDWLVAGLTGPDPTGDNVPLPHLALDQPVTPQAQNMAEQALEAWWLDRMIVTSTPLREKLTLLWHGHFATGFQKVRNAAMMYRQNQLIRTLGGGNFETLTRALAKDPAMMFWLDTQTDVAAHPNENFARELMELFTLGIGNYSETDVKEAARCFTGWAFRRTTGEFVFRPLVHDSGSKTLLGQTGPWNGDDAVRIVTHHPASSRWIAARLWSHLSYPVLPDAPVVAELAAGYRSDLNVTNLVRSILLHPEFAGSTARTGLVKQPVEYVVGVSRAFGLDASGSAKTALKLPQVLRQLAQEPLNPPNVGGWPQNEYWLNTATAQLRLQYAYNVGTTADLSALHALAPSQRPSALAHLLSIDGWGPTTNAALNHVAGDPPVLVALALSAPEYVLN